MTAPLLPSPHEDVHGRLTPATTRPGTLKFAHDNASGISRGIHIEAIGRTRRPLAVAIGSTPTKSYLT